MFVNFKAYSNVHMYIYSVDNRKISVGIIEIKTTKKSRKMKLSENMEVT